MSGSEQDQLHANTTFNDANLNSDSPTAEQPQGENKQSSKSYKSTRRRNPPGESNKSSTCKFFSTPSGCRFGDRCRFLHTENPTPGNTTKRTRTRRNKIPNKNKEASVSNNDEQNLSKDQLLQLTTKVDESANTPNREMGEIVTEKSDIVVSQSAQLTRHTELKQIQRRFKDSFEFNSTSTKVAPSFKIKLVPSDPEFPFELESLELNISLPEKYYNTNENSKEGVPLFEVLNDEIPKSLKKSVVNFLNQDAERLLVSPPGFLRARSQNGTIQILRPLLNKLDRELSNLLVEKVADIPPPKPIPAVAPPTTSSATIKFVRNNGPKHDKPVLSKEDPDGLNDLFSNSVRISQVESDDSLAISNVTGEIPLYRPSETDMKSNEQKKEDSEDKEEKLKNTGNVGCYDIKILDSHMEGVALVECILLSLSIKCVKCTTAMKSTCTVDMDLVPGKEMSKMCTNGKCGGLPVTVKFQPGMLHQNSDILGTIVIHPPYIFQPYDLLPSTYRLTCSSCPVPDDEENTITPNGITARRLAKSKMFTQRCHICHNNYTFSAEVVRFTSVAEHARLNLKLSDSATAGLKKKKKKELEELGLVPGQHLPDKGTCKHYKKSYRWLTFPCCGKSFPCDECHDDKSDHETQFASRMICGYCSSSQSFHPSRPCNSCGRLLVSSSAASGGHWEGGKGTRNQTRMSRKDAQKYRGLGKTVSNKTERVGKKK
ncbi:hypothetical protein K7432_000368 [Basidiobolus ranarum]|uniref:C3H1-type domain-containing protein n=1 Tax=Basidiobolus ranarum TaxID=34480 RepID=A0ABR2X4R2_9FUNG